MALTTTKIDDCDGCARQDIECWSLNNMLLCADCRKKELDGMAQSKQVPVTMESLVQKSQRQDAAIQVKADIFNASTVAFVELRASIMNDESIPADQKEYEFCKVVAERIKHFNDVIFSEEQALMEKKNERHAWNTQIKEYVNKLREDERAKVRQFDVNYSPAATPIKKIKAAATSGPKAGTKKFSKTELRDAAKKYNVPESAVQSMVVSRAGMSYEDAAKHIHDLMNP